MIKISQQVWAYIQTTPFLVEALAEDLINASALARKLQPELERIMRRPLQLGAITMAIKRAPIGPGVAMDRSLRQFFRQVSDISIKAGLIDYTYRNSPTLLEKHVALLAQISRAPQFYTFSQGVSETTMVVAAALKPVVEEIFAGEQLISRVEQLSAITLTLPKENQALYGIYYFILKEMAWKGLNLVEVISTSNEFTLIVAERDSESAFEVLMALRRG